LFQRQGRDLHFEMPITFSQAALGGSLEVPTLDGKYATASLAKGSQSGDEIRLSARGMPPLREAGERRAGDLVVHLRVITPRNLTKRQEELLRELGEIDKVQAPPERRGFLDRVKEFFTTFTTFTTTEQKAEGKPS